MSREKQERSRSLPPDPGRREFLRTAGLLALSGALGGLSPAASALAKSPDTPLDVVVVGGGLSGLAAAYLLKDYRVAVLERRVSPGGRIVAGRWRGLNYARGAQYLSRPVTDTVALVRRLGLNLMEVPGPATGVAMGGKVFAGSRFVDFLASRNVLAEYDRFTTALAPGLDEGLEEVILASPVERLPFDPWDRQSVAAWLKEKRFSYLLSRLVEATNRASVGASNRDLSFLFNLPGLAFSLADPDQRGDYDLFNFRQGMSELTGALTRQLGPVVQTGCDVERVYLGKDGFFTVIGRQFDEPFTVTAHSVVVATPAPVTVQICENGLAAPLRQALEAVHYAPFVTINLFLERRQLGQAFFTTFLDTFFVATYDAARMQLPPGSAGPSVLGVHLAPQAANDPYILQMSDELLLKLCLTDLERYAPGVANGLQGHDVYRFRHAFPVFAPGYNQVLAELESEDARKGPLFLAGDYLASPDVNGAILSATRAHQRVRLLLEAKGVLPSNLTPKPREAGP